MPPHDAQMRSPICKSAMDCSPPRTVQNVVAVQPRMVGSRRQSADAAFPAESDGILDELDGRPVDEAKLLSLIATRSSWSAPIPAERYSEGCCAPESRRYIRRS